MNNELKGLFNQENKDWYNAGFIGGFKDCKEKVLKILKEHTIESETQDEKNWNYIDESVIKEIENKL